MAAGSVSVMALSIIVLVVGVFLTIVGIVSIVKVIQIAEDLRYMRSKSDTSVRRPMKWQKILLICLGVSIVAALLLLALSGSAISILQPSTIASGAKLF